MTSRSSIYFINGRYVPSSKATISVHDLGFLRGFGLFESLRTYHRKPFLLEAHLNRLFGGLKQVSIKPVWLKREIERIVGALLKRNRFEEVLIRIFVTGGLASSILPKGKPSLVVLMDPLHSFPLWQYQKGIKLMTAPFRRIYPSIKTTVYFDAVLQSMKADRRGFTEVVYVDGKGALLEGSTYNVFAVLPGRKLVAPNEGILAGVTADCVLKIAKRLGMRVIRKPISLSMQRRAEEIFITSSNRELIPVASIDGRRFSKEPPGPITLQLHREYQAFVRAKLGSSGS